MVDWAGLEFADMNSTFMPPATSRVQGGRYYR